MQPPSPSHLTALAGKTDDWFRRARAALLSQLPCQAGCSQCCIGIFPITRLDLRLIREGLEHLRIDQRVRIETRAAQQIRALESAYPRLQSSPSLDDWPDQEIDKAAAAFHDAPCPALGDDGLCMLYDYRPLTCRSMGIPTRHDDIVNGACAVQTFVPIARLSASLEAQEEELAACEAVELATLPEVAAGGEELLLPYAFLGYQDRGPTTTGLGEIMTSTCELGDASLTKGPPLSA
jgi:Fe-S-cluster containining protein